MSGARLVRPHVARHWRALAGAGFATGLLAVAELASPWPLKLVIDRLLDDRAGSFVLEGDDAVLLGAAAGLMLLLALMRAGATYGADVWLTRAGERITHDLRVAVYAHLQRLSLAFHDRRQKGDLVSRVTGDVTAVGTLFSGSIGTIASAGLLLLGMAVITFILDPLLALTVFSIAPVLAFASVRYQRRIRMLARRQRAEEGEIASLATEALSAMQVVKAFGSEDFEHERVEERSEARRLLGVQLSSSEALYAGFVGLAGAVAGAAVLVVGVLRVSSGAITPGDLVVFTAYASRTYRPLRDISRQAGRIGRAMARAERVAELMGTDEALGERPNAHCGERAHGAIELRRVSFAYPGERPALHGLSLNVEPGTSVALVGASGAGKSTIGALIARFYDPSEGAVLIDGHDARDCSVEWLREQVGFLLQDTVLFRGTVAENIAYATAANHDEIVAAATAAGAHEFIERLPSGYETPLGPRGVGLSGGQRQRIGIARVFLRNPSVLVLDEPTTGLDVITEARLRSSLERLMRGRTTILATHSLTLARAADRVVVVDGGHVVQQGAPAALLRQAGAFRTLVQEAEAPPPRRRKPVARPPRDPALADFDTLLDPERMIQPLKATLDGAEIDTVEIRAVEYKPGASLAVHYAALLPSGHHDVVARAPARSHTDASELELRSLARRVSGRVPAPVAFSRLVRPDAIVHWLPLDPALPALAESSHSLAERLALDGILVGAVPAEPERLGYRAGQRAVLRLDGHVVKTYGLLGDLAAAVRGLRWASAHASFRTPHLETVWHDLRATVQPALPGQRVARERAASVAAEAGEILAHLHEQPVDGLLPVNAEFRLAAVLDTVELISAIRPDLARRVEALHGALHDSMPHAPIPVPCHGDFNVSQLLETPDGLVVLDFDELCAGDPALDLATYVANVVGGREGDLDAAEDVLAALIEGYGRVPDGLAWYLAVSVLRRAPSSFRLFKKRWPERVEATVEMTERLLEPWSCVRCA